MMRAVEKRNKIVVVGVGKSGHIGEKIAATLTSTGSPAVVLNSMNALHGDLGVVADGDIVLALSYSGETEELTRLVPALRRFDVKMIAITGNAKSFLAAQADLHLDAHVGQEACPLNLAPTSSTTAMLVLGDALAMVLLEARGFKKEDFATFHPGGTLGRNLLMKVQDIMRTREQMAVLSGSATVNEALALIGSKRAGAIAVIDKKGQLAGIYTHGDFTRGYQKDVNIGRAKLAEVMTKNPITVRVEKLAVEVLNLFEKHRIGDLIVVDRKNQPVGLVDAQDLAKVKLL
jgi:arabinose-5-phosphate isomerase